MPDGLPDAPLLAALLRQLEDRKTLDLPSRTTLELMTGLLQFCRAHERQARRAVPAVPPGWQDAFVADVAGAAVGVFADGGWSNYVDDAAVDAFAGLVSEHVHAVQDTALLDLAAVVAAHGVALAADVEFHTRWQAEWRRNLAMDVRGGVLHPVFAHDPTGWIAPNKANTQPGNYPTTPLDALPHVRLGSDSMDAFSISVNYDVWGHAAPLADVQDLRLAACQPNLTTADFDVRWERDRDPPVFHNRGAHDPALQRHRALAAVAAAGDAGASVVVVPEYCLPADERDAFKRAVARLPRRPVLIVGGSSETENPDGVDPINEGWLLVSDEYERPFVKLTPAVVAGATEGVQERRDLTVFPTERLAVAVLICRDATSPEIVEALAQLGVGLLLVPAFSPRTGTMMSLAGSLSGRSQAFSAVAVAPAVWPPEDDPQPLASRPADAPPRDEAAFSGPYETAPYAYYAPGDLPEGQAPEGTGAWVFDVRARTVSWAPSGPV